jgi:hypothetical protein
MVRLEQLEDYGYDHTSGEDLRFNQDGPIKMTGFGARVPLRDIPTTDVTGYGMSIGLLWWTDKYEPATPYCAEYICAEANQVAGYSPSYHNQGPSGEYIIPWQCDSIMCVTWEPTGVDTCYHSRYSEGSARYGGGWQSVQGPGRAYFRPLYDSNGDFTGYRTIWPHQWPRGYASMASPSTPIGYLRRDDPTSGSLPYWVQRFREGSMYERSPFRYFKFRREFVDSDRDPIPTAGDEGLEGTPTTPRGYNGGPIGG